MKWVLQVYNFQLGNFVMITPLIRHLSNVEHKRIPVFFETSKVAELYEQCPFIERLKTKPTNPPYFSSARPKNRKSHESDLTCMARTVFGPKAKIDFSTYVDRQITLPLEKKPNTKYVALFHGCLSKTWREKKTLPLPVIHYLPERMAKCGHVPVLLGSKDDNTYYWSRINKPPTCLDFVGKLSLRDSVSILAQCDLFIGNDSGLYHVAGALGLRGLVLWYQTNMQKNKAPSDAIQHYRGKTAVEFQKAVKKFSKQI